MKHILHTLLLCGSLLALASCGTDDLLPATPDGGGDSAPDAQPNITITADMGTSTSTRTGHDDVTAEGVKVNWAEGDKFVIHSLDADGKCVGSSIFTLVAGEAGKASAAFEGTKPVAGAGGYAICYPAEVTISAEGWNACYSMRGQKQTGNNSTAHLSKFDPMLGHLVTAGDFSKISFTPDVTHQWSGHSAMLMTLDLTNIPTDLGTPERIVLGTKEGNTSFYDEVLVSWDLVNGPADIVPSSSSTFTLDLENVTASGQRITAYMMLTPTKVYEDDALTITLEGSQKSYTFTSPPFSQNLYYREGMRYIASAGTWTTEAVIEYDEWANTPDNYTGGDGTVASPYLISTAKDLKMLQEDKQTSGKYFKLTRNINIPSGTTWKPIGTTTYFFKGHFDGNGRTISGEMKGTDGNFGFFGAIEGATITNLHVSATVTNTNSLGNAGAIAGSANSSTISYCTNAGAVSGISYSGGIVGKIEGGTLINCTNTGSVTAADYSVGGITGYSISSAIIGCGNTGGITSSSSPVGGIVGLFDTPAGTTGTIYGCFNTGLIEDSSFKGAIIGGNDVSGTFIMESCRYVLAEYQSTYNFTACFQRTDDSFTDVAVCADVAALNADAVLDALNAGITKWNSTATAGLPPCFLFKSGGSAAPAITFPASSGGIGGITDGGDALN